ncbi:MAG TPA: HD domain-containing protein [Gemmatimonadales bacterium]|nr:HD domain-containing protein [Gemmatimonadales bacterium]
MTPPCYSDRINHAFAFAAKYHAPRAPAGGTMAFVAHPSNVAVILARYGCAESTIVAGILHHVLEECDPTRRGDLETRIDRKFGPVILAIAKDAVEPKYDARGRERPWRSWKQDYLANLASAEPPALDICVADEIHGCGSAISTIRRLGREYLRTETRAAFDETLWWYRCAIEVLESREDWPGRPMLNELRLLSAQLIRSLTEAER